MIAGPDYRLHMPVSNMENLNSAEYLEHIKAQLFGVLKQVEPAPGVQIKSAATDEDDVAMHATQSAEQARAPRLDVSTLCFSGLEVGHRDVPRTISRST